MLTEKRKKFIINFLYFAIIVGIAVFICRYALGVLFPFFVALVVSFLLKPVIRFLTQKCRFHKTAAGLLTTILFYALIGFLLTISGMKLFTTIKDFVLDLPSHYHNRIEPLLTNIFDSLERFTERLDPGAAAAYDVIYDNITQSIQDGIVTLSKVVGNNIKNIAVGTPRFLLNMLIMVIATVFIAIDWDVLKDFILLQCTEKTRRLLHDIRTHLSLTLWRYIKSYLLIMLITFSEICIGLFIIGINNAFLIATLIAVFDLLPVVGSGMVLLPWTILTALQGNYPQAIGLGILYIVVIVVRNIIEPKIVGNHVGLHPIVTLMAMVIGVFVFGPVGLLGLPITLALLQSLNEQGVIHLYKRKAFTEDPSDKTPPKKPFWKKATPSQKDTNHANTSAAAPDSDQ